MRDSTSHPLDYLFHPQSVAVAGVSTKRRDWGGGEMFVRALQAAEFPGPIYPLNPNAEELLGLKSYSSLREIPGPADYVISSIPIKGVPQLVEDAVAKGVRAIHFFTAGFSETGDEDRIELERRILERARAGGVRIIGPNCMGLYCPASGLSFNPEFPKESGNVALVSQSGLNVQEIVSYSVLRGVRFSKVISYGNAVDLNESDFFEYCTADPETEVIISYIEGVRDGPRFLGALRAAAASKPVIILKGGVTVAGTRAAHSHTGSLAGSAQVWAALCRQSGALGVESLEELEDMAATFSFLKEPAGPGVAIIVVGGGISVLAADAAEKMGLKVPPLPAETEEALHQFTPIEGTSIRNPLDIAVILRSREDFLKAFRIVADAPNIHTLLVLMRVDWGARPNQNPEEFVRQSVDTLAEAASQIEKPVAVAVRPPRSAQVMDMLLDFQDRCAKAGLAVYPSIDRALGAIVGFLRWRQVRDGRLEGQ
jgi:acyl-CoA synthetase (NDP forming)